MREAAACEAKFQREGVGPEPNCDTLLVLWFLRRWIWIHIALKQSGALTATERPGAVYLAAALAGHTQKGIPAFGIYGKDVQEAGDETMPEDVVEKLLNFARAGLAVGFMRGKVISLDGWHIDGYRWLGSRLVVLGSAHLACVSKRST